MSRELQLFLEDIESGCRKIIRYTDGLSRDEVFGEEMRFDAVLHNLHVIGEAVAVYRDWSPAWKNDVARAELHRHHAENRTSRCDPLRPDDLRDDGGGVAAGGRGGRIGWSRS